MFIDDSTTVEFNGSDLTWYCTVEAVRLPVMAPIRNDWLENLSNRFGRAHRRARPDRYPIEIDIRIWSKNGDPVESIAADLAAILYTEKPAELVIGQRRYNAILDGETNLSDFFDLNASTTLRFVTGEATWHESKVTHVLAAGSNTVNMPGTAETAAIVNVTAVGAVSMVKVKIGADEITITRATRTWPNGTVFTVDTETGSVLIDSIDGRKYLTLDSRFGLLKPGNNTIVLTGGAGSIEFNPRWR